MRVKDVLMYFKLVVFPLKFNKAENCEIRRRRVEG